MFVFGLMLGVFIGIVIMGLLHANGGAYEDDAIDLELDNKGLKKQVDELKQALESAKAENEQLKAKHAELNDFEKSQCAKLLAENGQLKGQNKAMWDALAQFKYDYEQDTNMSSNYHDVCKLLREESTTYHNPADMELLKKAKQALLVVFRENPSQENMEFAEYVLAAIDKSGGGQNG